jgi:hypothetical protein
MIHVTPTSAYMNAYGGTASTYISSNPNNPVQGMLRLQNGSTLQVFDGAGWINMNMNISVGLDSEGEAAITWVRERMAQEQRWAELSKQYPAVADALAAREQAEQALAVVSRLCGELGS